MNGPELACPTARLQGLTLCYAWYEGLSMASRGQMDLQVSQEGVPPEACDCWRISHGL